MTTYYKATFSDGTVVKRITKGRTYTHAWLIRRRTSDEYISRGFDPIHQDHGFSGSQHNAEAQLRRYDWAPDRRLFAEVAPAVEVTHKEYKS